MEKVTSFLVREGRAIRPDLHWERMGANLAGTLFVPSVGQYFPQYRSYGGQSYGRLRPAPRLRTSTRLWLTADRRNQPRVKGPDMSTQLAQRAQALACGADDAALYRGNHLLEGANSALLFYRGGRWVQAGRSQVLASTTVRAAVEAGLLEAPLRQSLPLALIPGTPAVCASALHGFTPVAGWVLGGKYYPAPAPDLDCAWVNARLWDDAQLLR